MHYAAFERLAQEKQSSILNAGIAEFSTFSYSDANADRIIATCGISKGLLYYYFGTKKEFYLYGIDRAMEALLIYSNAVINRYMAQYQSTPNVFLKNTQKSKEKSSNISTGCCTEFARKIKNEKSWFIYGNASVQTISKDGHSFSRGTAPAAL